MSCVVAHEATIHIKNDVASPARRRSSAEVAETRDDSRASTVAVRSGTPALILLLESARKLREFIEQEFGVRFHGVARALEASIVVVLEIGVGAQDWNEEADTNC